MTRLFLNNPVDEGAQKLSTGSMDEWNLRDLKITCQLKLIPVLFVFIYGLSLFYKKC